MDSVGLYWTVSYSRRLQVQSLCRTHKYLKIRNLRIKIRKNRPNLEPCPPRFYAQIRRIFGLDTKTNQVSGKAAAPGIDKTITESSASEAFSPRETLEELAIGAANRWYFRGEVLPKELERFRPATEGNGPLAKIILDIPFRYRDIAANAGARWDSENKVYFFDKRPGYENDSVP